MRRTSEVLTRGEIIEIDRVARRPSTPFDSRVLAVALTIVVYVALIVALGGRAHLGGDTGGRAAVLRSVGTGEHPHFDVGYWAVDEDPDLDLHPLYYTQVIAGRAQQLSTLPMLWIARPLYYAGGERAALALPVLGAIGGALAAAALARRLGATRPMIAYWVIALASPVVLYAVDLWEHSLGLAAALWAIVVLEDIVAAGADRRGVLSRAIVAGALFGIGATLRTEVLVVGAVFGAAAVLRLGAGRHATTAWRVALGGTVGVVSAWTANDILERSVLGGSLRSGRAADVATGAGAHVAQRFDDAWVSLSGLNYANATTDRALGSVLLIGIVVAGVGTLRRRPRLATIGAVTAVAAMAIRLAGGLSFIPGVVPVLPLAAFGAVVGVGASRARWLSLAALVAFPAVWLTAYSGMPGAQWGGRYLFVPAAVLVVVAVSTGAVNTLAGRVFVGLGIAVSISGVLYLGVRGGEVDRAERAAADLDRGEVDLVISRVPFLWRELGSEYRPESAHLTAVGEAELVAAGRVASARAFGSIVVLQESDDPPMPIDGFAPVGVDPFPWIGRSLKAVLYEATVDAPAAHGA